jgi:predicted aspartyl protease
MVNRKVLVPVVLNGAPPKIFILDTGANVTVVSPGLARTLGFEQVPGEARGTARMASGQEVEVTARRLASIAVGGARIDNFGVVIYDLAGVTQSVGSGIVVDGLLGIDFVGRFTTTIDVRNQTLIFQLDEPAPR